MFAVDGLNESVINKIRSFIRSDNIFLAALIMAEGNFSLIIKSAVGFVGFLDY